ncbi:MAG: hypothetical protein GY795_48205 [Desulfobacterales bacterium]|nr:hypothetical protein [Desulfobacterales bacterium]
MMQALKIKRHLDSEIIHIPVSKDMIGKDAEIIILTEPHQEPDRKIKSKRKPGSAIGMITVADDFESPLDDEILREFYKLS